MLDILQTADVIEACENLLHKRRPPLELRHEVDLSYRIDDHTVFIFEIRARWDKKDELCESPIAKTNFIKSQNLWKVYWMRSDRKWHSYKPTPSVKTIKDFIKLVDLDPHGCFWG